MVSSLRFHFCRAICRGIAPSSRDWITSGAVFGVVAAPCGLRWGRAPGSVPQHRHSPMAEMVASSKDLYEALGTCPVYSLCGCWALTAGVTASTAGC